MLPRHRPYCCPYRATPKKKPANSDFFVNRKNPCKSGVKYQMAVRSFASRNHDFWAAIWHG